MSNVILQVLDSEIVQGILAGLIVAIFGMLAELVRRVLKKYKYAISAEQDAKIDYLAKKGAAFVTEEVRLRVKLGQAPLSSSQRKDLAVDKVLEWAPDLAKHDAGKVGDTVQAVLPEVRAALEPGKAPVTGPTPAPVLSPNP